MADETYRVVTIYETQGLGQIAPEARAGAEAMDHLGKSAEHTKGVLSHMNEFALGYLGFHQLAHDAVGLGEKLINLSAQFESTRIAMAGMIQAGRFTGIGDGVEGFNRALSVSDALLTKIREHSRTFHGTFDDLLQINQMNIASGAHSGMTLDQIEQMAYKVGNVGKMFGIDAGSTGHALSQMLEGHARSISPLFRKLAGFMDDGGGGFNALSPEKRVEAINKAVAGFEPAMKAYGETWGAIVTTTQSYEKVVMRTFGKAFFDQAKSALVEINAWFEKNRESILKTAEALGHGIVDALREASKYGQQIGAFLIDNKESIKVLAEVWLAQRAMGAVGMGFGGVSGGMPGLTMGKQLTGYSMVNMGGGMTRQMELYGHKLQGGLEGALGTVTNAVMRSGVNVAVARFTNNVSDLGTGTQHFQDAVGILTGSLSALPGQFGQVGGALSALYASLNVLAGEVDKNHKSRVLAEAEGAAVRDEVERYYKATGGHKEMVASRRRFASVLQNHGVDADVIEAMGDWRGAVDNGKTGNLDGFEVMARNLGNKALPMVEMARRMGAYNKFGGVDEARVRAWMKENNLDGGTQSQQDEWVRKVMLPIYDSTEAYKLANPAKFRKMMEEDHPAGASLAISGKNEPGKKAAVNVVVNLTQEINNGEDPDRIHIATTRAIKDALRTHVPTDPGSLGSLIG